MDVVLLEVEFRVQFGHLERQRQQASSLQFGEVRGDHFEQFLGHLAPGFQIAAGANLEGHVDEGVVVPAIGHAPGVQAHGAAANAAEGEDPAFA
ncbi:hypothetical protein D9M68_747110 [compost metagenome]